MGVEKKMQFTVIFTEVDWGREYLICESKILEQLIYMNKGSKEKYNSIRSPFLATIYWI